jgi:hypothetical protein
MNLLTAEDLRGLAMETEGPCISLYIPTVRASEEIRQNPIRFKNLIRQAEDQLPGYGLRPAEIKSLLEPAYELLLDEVFWQYQSDGLAVYLSNSTTRFYRLPLNFKELVYIGDRFYTKPLLSYFTANGAFYLLALSKDQVRLLKGTRYSVDEITLDDVPESMAEALQWDDPEPSLQHHASEGPSTGGEKAGMFHGHGKGEEIHNTDLLRYFQQVSAGIEDMLADEDTPLVLAGVEYLLPIYRKANSYRYLVEQVIPGSPDRLSDEELHRKAIQLLEPLFREEVGKAVEIFGNSSSNGKTTADLREIVQAAAYGRVDQLFISTDEHQWGSFDNESGEVHIHQDPHPASLDLLDFAATQTFINGGKVYALNQEEMPADKNAAAILRWPNT